MDVVVIAGSPASGKTTVAWAIRSRLGCAHIDLGNIREFYLDREWQNENPDEAQMAFRICCHTAREFVRNGIRPVLIDDLRPEHVRQAPGEFEGVASGIITLVVRDRDELESRMRDPTRDSGFDDLDAAWAWNRAEADRELLPGEVRLDTTDQTIEQTVERVLAIVTSEPRERGGGRVE